MASTNRLKCRVSEEIRSDEYLGVESDPLQIIAAALGIGSRWSHMKGRRSPFDQSPSSDLLVGGLVVAVIVGVVTSELLGWGLTDAFQAIGTIVLSALLVRIYAQQVDIMSRQEEIMRIDQEPVVSYDRYRADDDAVGVWLTNSGRGTAMDVRAKLEVQLPDGTHLRTPEDNSPLSTREDDVWQPGRPLDPGRSEVRYYGTPVIEIEDENGNVTARRFRRATEILLSRGIHEFDFRLSVVYSTEMGEEHELPLRSLHTVELTDPLTLETAIELSRKYPHDHSKWRDETIS